ncbi:MAG TPA: hypothetical protein VHH35_06295 [Pyrinomonadaceae bacterium]|nr:hypothetical protein [Pyrinomonadaceae bacterium]
MQARAQTVLPRFIAPPAPLCLWLLLSCLIAASVLAWLTRVPVYLNGIATVVDANARDQHPNDEELIVAFFPPESKAEMRTGQNLSLKLDPDGPPLIRTISVIEPGILSPADARKKFNLDDTTSRTYQSPAAIAIARLGKPSEQLPAGVYEGIVVEAWVETGSQRLIALLPLVGRFFRN